MKDNEIIKRSIIIFLIFCGSLFAEVSKKNGTTAAQFLKIGVGARSMGMAGAYVAAANDAFSLYWNPAAITQVNKISLVGSYINWFAGIKHQFMGFVIPIDATSSVGLQATFLNMDDMEITTVSDPHGTGEFFEAYDISLGVTYGKKLTDFFSLGITAKYIEQTIYNESSSTFAFDVGSMLEIPFQGLKLGMRMANFGGKMQLDGRDLTREFDMNPNNTFNVGVETRLKTEPWDLPVIFQVGLSTDIVGQGETFYNSEKNRLTFSVDGSHPTDSPEFVSFGLEYSFNETIALRSGYRLNRDVEKLFYGIGLNVPLGNTGFHFDYGLASFEELDYVHIFSGSIDF